MTVVMCQRRMGRLTGGVGMIKVGAPTEVELADCKLRFENALNVSMFVMEQGYVPGGDAALLIAGQALAEFMTSSTTGERRLDFDIVCRSFEEPLSQIAVNAGLSCKVVVQNVKTADEWFGFDALSLRYLYTGAAGIVDSSDLLATAIQNVASIAALVQATEAVVAESTQAALY